ncbi:MAG: NADPH-dependent FMN reductase [Leptospirales bacterium]
MEQAEQDGSTSGVQDVIRILAISGSLRKASSNTALLRAASMLAPEGLEITVYAGLGDLPLFNPDIEGPDFDHPTPIQVRELRSLLLASDGVLIASPEYAHGVTGALKNAIDWVVGSGELVEKPVALLNASAQATHAQSSLREILSIASVRFVADASRTISLSTNKTSPVDIVSDPERSGILRAALISFMQAVENQRDRLRLHSSDLNRSSPTP